MKHNQKNAIYRKWLKINVWGAIAILFVATTLLFSSCEKKELCEMVHPHDKKVCHTKLTLNFNSTWENDPIYSVHTRATATSGVGLPMRYVVEFWSLNEEGELATLIERKDVTQGKLVEGNNSATIEVDLPAMPITTLCWAEPLPNGSTVNPFFNTEKLREVTLVAPYGNYIGKDAFTNSTTWDYSSHIYELDGINLNETITLQRPFGHYTAITNDVEEYLIEFGHISPLPATAKVNYQLWIPAAFDVLRQIPVAPLSNASYSYPVTTRIADKELNLAEDVIFINTNGQETSTYNFLINTFAENGNPVHQSGNVEVKIKRNCHTLIYGAFLTDRKSSVPGIDDSFDGGIEVEIPD